MTHEELIKTIKQFSVEDRIRVRDAISQSIADEAEPSKTRASIADKLSRVTKPDSLTAGCTAGEANGHSLSRQLYGILEFEGGPPTDDEVKDMIADYLLKKYY
ncbi:MAG: hypothetical protein QOK48_1059 [Blastocatellia bacterium]|jgi:hypothetical protein|nr:hypothetical protein [Blastocatellia bacterium]